MLHLVWVPFSSHALMRSCEQVASVELAFASKKSFFPAWLYAALHHFFISLEQYVRTRSYKANRVAVNTEKKPVFMHQNVPPSLDKLVLNHYVRTAAALLLSIVILP